LGNWTVYLDLQEEEEIKKRVEKGEVRSVYAFIKRAVRRALESGH